MRPPPCFLFANSFGRTSPTRRCRWGCAKPRTHMDSVSALPSHSARYLTCSSSFSICMASYSAVRAAACRGDLLQALPQAVNERRQPVAVDPTLAWREDHAPGKADLDPVERPAFSDFLEISQDIVVDLGQREIPAAVVFVRRPGTRNCHSGCSTFIGITANGPRSLSRLFIRWA